MKNLFCAFGKRSSTVLSLVLAIVVSLVGFVSLQTTALAATTVTVDNSYTWAQLKTAVETTYKGKEVVFNINRTSVLSATSLISVPAGTTVTLKCTNTAHTDPSNTDICRGIDYHGSLFEIVDGASLVVECCISGGADTVNGSLVYDRTSGTATLITDTTKLSTVSQKLRAGNYRYAPINYKYYGSALISVKGSLKVNNGVLKYNYNPYSSANTNSSTSNTKFNNGVYSNANTNFVNRYYETLDDGTKIGLAYYTLPCKYDGADPVGVGGSAISVYEGGFFSITNSSLYGFTSDTGPAIGCEGVDYGASSLVSNSKIFMNVARDVGGAVYHVANINKPATVDVFLTLDGSEVYYNRAQNAGGAIITGYSAVTDIKSCKIYNNIAGTYGGGLVVNGGASKAEGNTSHPTQGGTTTISGCDIYNNKAGSNGGGISTRPTPDTASNESGNVLTIENTKIHDNSATGSYTPTTTNGNTGFGGGLYISDYCKLTIKGSDIYENISNGGDCKVNGSVTAKPGVGGGVYITSAGPACSINASIYNNEAVGTGSYGGGVATSRTKGLTLNGFVYENIINAGLGAGIYNTALLNLACSVESNTGAKNGGGLYNSGTANIVGGVIYKNTASGYGGGISNGGTITIKDASISENTAVSGGGGIYNAGTITVYADTTVSENVVKSGETVTNYGGGIYNAKTLTVEGGTINANKASYGAGIFNSSAGTTTVSGGEICYNESTNNGGGISNAGTLTIKGGRIYSNTAANGGGVLVAGDSCKLTLTAGTISGNTADFGGGLWLQVSGTTTIGENVVIDGNTANTHGGGIYTKAGTLTVDGGTISNNTAKWGGGMYNSGTATISGGVISGNTVTENGGGISNAGIATISGGTISENTGKNGGGISNGGTLTIKDGTISNNTATEYGGGIYNTATLDLVKVVIEKNLAYSKEEYMVNGCGGGIYSVKSFSLPAGVVIKGNTATNGGGVYIDTDWDATTENVVTLTLDGAEITDNTATDGGGVLISHSNMIMKSGKVSGNTAGDWGGDESFGSGAGIYLSGNSKTDRGILTISGGEISNNRVVSTYSADGGGIYNHWGTINMSGGIITNNSCTSDDYSTGGGVYLEERAVLNMTGGTISKNSAESGGGVALVYYWDSFATIGGNAVITENNADYGGGIYNYGCGSVEEDGTEIIAVHIKDDSSVYNNTASVSGGGLYLDGGVAKISGGKMYKNTAKYGGGALLYYESLLTLTSNSIYSNTAEYGIGVYVCGAGEYNDISTFKMYDAACVGDTDRNGIGDTDDVYLEEGTYITVPSLFTYTSTGNAITTGKKALRAIVTPEPSVTGRVIAKFGASAEDKGSQALYWNADTPKMSEQHFTVKGKVLRSGDQGAADNYEALNYQDVFLSEEYTVSFDMNPTAVMLAENITLKHIVGNNEYVFDDLANKTLNKNLYYKYWNEACSFNTGHVSNNGIGKFIDWNLSKDGSGKTYKADETVTLELLANENLVFYAQWTELIDIDYNGNGATSGDDWTEEKVDANNDYTLHDGKNDDGSPSFERIEEGENGQNILYNFVGWSFQQLSTPEQQYQFNETVTVEDLKDIPKEILPGRERAVATVYAAWDRYPEIEAVDRWFTLDDAQKGKITFDELMSTAIACDGFDAEGNEMYEPDENGDSVPVWEGVNTNYTDNEISGKEAFTIIDYSQADFTSFKKSGNVTVTYKAVDTVGNETYKTIIVHIVDKNQQIGDLVDRFVRFISKKFYKDDAGLVVSESNGGLNSESLWLTDDNYKTVITKALNNKKNEETGAWDFVYESWHLSIDEVKEAKNFVDEHGLGNSAEENALTVFYEKFYN